MKPLMLALLCSALLAPVSRADDKPNPTPAPSPNQSGPDIDETDPPRAPPYGPSAPSCNVEGRDISTDPAGILDAIKNAQFCWQAVQLAENCSSNEGGDVAYVNAAAPKCMKEFVTNKPTAKEKALLSTMTSVCDGKWKGKPGSQHVSQNAFCKLKALFWMDNLTSENQTAN